MVPPSAVSSPHRYSEDPAGPPLSPNRRHDRPDGTGATDAASPTSAHTNVSFATGHHLQLLPTPRSVSAMTLLPVDEREASSSLAVSASTASRPATPSAITAGQHVHHGRSPLPSAAATSTTHLLDIHSPPSSPREAAQASPAAASAAAAAVATRALHADTVAFASRQHVDRPGVPYGGHAHGRDG
jgi:hypothetical protein